MAKLDYKLGIVLASGKTFPNAGAGCFLGINDQATKLSWGYDSGFHIGYDDNGNDIELTQAEKAEIADMMVELWRKWAGEVDTIDWQIGTNWD